MCVSTYNDVLDDSKCSQQEKLTVQRCSDFSCPQWRTGDWSEVGAGHQGGLTLLVLHPKGLVSAKGVSISACDLFVHPAEGGKPVQREASDRQQSHWPCYRWSSGHFPPCKATGG